MQLSQSSSPVALADAKNVGGNRAASRTGNYASGAPNKPINRFRPMVEALFNEADVAIDGHQPWDIAVHDNRFYQRLLTDGSLGMGESYMDGWWDSQRVDEMISRLLRAGLGEKIQPRKFLYLFLLAHLMNPQRRSKAYEVGERHYDLGNNLFQHMLDKRMTYTCAYWSGTPAPRDLDEAQEAKLDLICRKLELKPGQHVLDIGCGWGSFMIYVAERYGAIATGVTVSKEQVALGRERAAALPVTFQLKDYREITGSYDHVVSLGMFEHVGPRNHRTFMEITNKVLKDNGLFLLQIAARNDSRTLPDPWSNKYIFPNTFLPSLGEIAASTNGLFVMEELHNFGADYDHTLLAWHKNFENAWPILKHQYSERFYRMWRYYLLAAAGLSRSRAGQLWQMVFSKKGLPGGYRTVR
jgi:cyclopropane-fatty-acyl-phospholipid synthase